MVGSKKPIDHRSNSDDGVDKESPSSKVSSCSICLDLVADDGSRSWAKLHCGHQFHLDCVGSVFNTKGVMQCPNCLKVEKGQWLFANGSSHLSPHFSLDDLLPDFDLYDLNYSETPSGVHWCPFGELHFQSSFGEEESPPSTYLDLRGDHSGYTEQNPASSLAHPFVTFGIPRASSRSNNIVDDSNYDYHWSGPSGQNDIVSHQSYPTINVQYRSWGLFSPPFPILANHNAANPAPPLTSISGEPDTRTRPLSSQHPLLHDPWSRPSVSGSFPSVAPLHPGTSAQAHEFHLSHVINQRQQLRSSPRLPPHVIHGIRSLDDSRALSMLVAPPLYDHGGIVFIPPSSATIQGNIQVLERRDPFHHPSSNISSSWGFFPQNLGGTNSGDSASRF